MTRITLDNFEGQYDVPLEEALKRLRTDLDIRCRILEENFNMNERILKKILNLLPLDGEYALTDGEKDYVNRIKNQSGYD